MIQYNLNKIQDIFYVTNEGLDTISYTISKKNDCVNYNVVSNGEIPVGETVPLNFEEDGTYQITLSTQSSANTVFKVKSYFNLQKSIIESIFNTLCDCDCGCSNCVDTSRNELCNLMIVNSKISTYLNLMYPEVQEIQNTIFNIVECLIVPTVYCSVTEEIIRGEANCNIKLFKQLLALDYLTMYFTEFIAVTNPGDLKYLQDKFMTKDIFCCIHKLGINIKELEQQIKTPIILVPFSAGYDILTYSKACSAYYGGFFTPIYIEENTDLITTTKIFSTPDGSEFAISGFYSDGNRVVEWNSTTGTITKTYYCST